MLLRFYSAAAADASLPPLLFRYARQIYRVTPRFRLFDAADIVQARHTYRSVTRRSAD